MASIRASGLQHTYEGADVPSLEQIDLDIADGEAHALLGASGAGKSTLLHLLAGILTPDQGRLELDGEDVTRLDGRTRNVAQVFQFPVLYPAMDVCANLMFPLEARGWKRPAARSRACEVAELLDIEDLLSRRVPQLSLFEKQLVAIGRALVRPDVSVVLLDEPLTAVEPSIKWRLRSALKTVQAELGLTMVYVTHDQVEALTFAERISMLMRGRIVQTGTPQDLYERPRTPEVARFVGSPGMNLLEARIDHGTVRLGEHRLAEVGGLEDGSCTVGFRPEWSQVAAGPEHSGVPIEVTDWRPLGAQGRDVDALISARCHLAPAADLYVRQAFHGEPPRQGWLCIDANRLVIYRGGQLLYAA